MTYSIAIITPTFQRIKGLERACDSIDAQTRKDWKHYIVVDGDPQTSKYLTHRVNWDKAMQSGQRVVIDLPENHNDLGVTPLNEGIKASAEPLFCVLADDNIFMPHHINTLVTFLERNKEYDFAYGNTILKHKNVPELYLIRCSPEPAWNHTDLGEPVYRRELWDEFGPYKYEDDPESGLVSTGKPGNRYSYDWHFIRKTLDGGAKWYYLNGNPSLVWYMDNKHLDPERFNHRRLMIAAWRAGDGGCAFYRLKSPLNIIHETEKADVKYWEKQMNWSETDVLMAMSDVLIFQAVSSHSIAERMEEVKRLGKVCIIDADDYSFALDPDNPKYVTMGAGEVQFSFTDKEDCIAKIRLFIEGMKEYNFPCPHLHSRIAEIEAQDKPPYMFHLYKDGFGGFSIEKNVKVMEAIGECYRRADALTCTTEKLAERLRLYNPNVYVMPNCIDTKSLWRNDLKIQGDCKTRIFWSGGHSHYLDLLPYRDALLEILVENKDVVLALMGFAPPAFIEGFPKDQIETYPWADLKEHPYRVHRARPDIGIIPLRTSDFADCKSPVKYLELAALGVPCAVSDSVVYTPVVKDGENGLLFNSPAGMKSSVKRLIVDKEMRVKIGTAARVTAEQYDARDRANEWLRLYEYLWLKKNFNNPTGNTLYPHLLKKWEDTVGHKINTIKQLGSAWDSRVATDTLPVDETAPTPILSLVTR